MRRYLIVGILVFVAAAAGSALAVVRDLHRYEDRLLPGVAIAGQDLGGVTVPEAVTRAQAIVGAHLRRPLVLGLAGESVQLTYGQLGIRADVRGAVEAAYALGHSEPLWSRWMTRLHLARNPVNISLFHPIHHARANDAIEAVLTEVAIRLAPEPQNAQVAVRDGTVIVTRPSQVGRVLNVPATRERIIATLNADRGAVDAAIQTVAPKFTTQDAQDLRGGIASFTTRLAPIPNRTHNIALAAGFIRGRMLAPGEVFSYNQAIGPTTPARGFAEAPVLINDELVPGEGGGVCQASSTLFNVALLADLQILARVNHSRPVAYLPIGRDATVNSGVLDLRFRNTTGHFLLLWASVEGQSLTITAYGTPVAGKEISIVVADREEFAPPQGTLVKEDPALEAGQVVTREPQIGYRVKTYRVVKMNGQVIHKELVAISQYRAVPRTVKLGTKKPELSTVRS